MKLILIFFFLVFVIFSRRLFLKSKSVSAFFLEILLEIYILHSNVGHFFIF